MRHSTVSAPIESCNVSSLSTPALRFCAVHLLHGQVLYFVVEPKSKTKELYNQACAHLASQGMLDTDLFGLAVISDGEYLFVDPDYKLSKYAPKSWRSSSTHGLDNSGKPLLAFYFRVQFYVDNPLLLRDETTRHHYYLQLRHNVVYRSLVYTYVAEEIIYLLVGLALQADFGDYLETQHTENYFSLQEYFPQQMVAHGNETKLYQNAAVVHKANRALSKAQAETQFIREASSRDSFPLAHNSHLYRLKQKKHDPNPGTLWLAICTRGIELYEERSNKPISGTFCWNNIGKLCFDRKKFEIRSLNPAGERYVYYTNSDEKSKHLLTLCRLTHQFCMSIQLRLNEITRKEEEEKNQYRDWGSELSVKLTEMCYNHNADQRISVISTTSSNTTSGIVSDRVHSLDESEDDLDMEIMINSPPAASIESLALAHLRDSFNTENRKINKIVARSSPAYHNSVGAQDENSDLCCLSKLTLPTTPAPTDDSQCSSSCSTIVVTGYGHDKTKTQQQETTGLSSNRRHSTSSSLELGYSHTAQNSALSDSASCCLELDYSVQSAHTSSGIYTLQSSCETNTVATTAAAASSETSGIGHSVVEDSEGIRSRSGSIVSASGSFHGDGSDPSDTGHGTPLTAEELSDLIVGRSPKPCRGKYPSVATVSESLDSIADYVTLPPPPIPPPRRTPLMESMSRHNLGGAFSSKSSDTTSSYVARQGSISTASHSDSNKNYFSSEEAMLQRQIQFQHLTGGFSSHLLMDTIAPANQIQMQMQMQMQPTSAKMLMCSSNDDITASNIDSNFSSCYPVASVATATSVASAVSAPLLKSKFQQNHKSCISLPLRSEEASARIVSTKPQINVLKAQSSYVPSGSLIPSYASPAAINYNVPTSVCRSTSLQQQHQHHQHQQLQQPPQIQPNYHQKYTTDVSTRLDYAAAAAAAANQVPIVGSNNYLDVRRSGVAFLQQIHEKFPPPPPLLYSRQPPPPPPPPRNHYSMCNNNLLSHQFDQYKQQLYSDVDYVIYPMKDPAISKQEYLDSKEASYHCNQHYLSQSSLSSRYARPFPSTYNVFAPPPAAAPTPYSLYGGRKSQAMYRSTPNVAVAGGGCISSYCQHAANARYASNQNLSAELSGYSNSSLAYLSAKHASSTSPLYSAAASMYSSSMQSLRLDSSIYGRILPSSSNCSFSRTRSDDNILNCGDRINVDHHLDVKFRKPPPPPPPPYNSQKHYICSERVKKPELPPPEVTSRVNQTEVNSPPKDKNISLDICSLREKSKDLDLPLISALCNDKSLLKQTNTIDLASEPPTPWYNDTDENIPKDESLVAKASNKQPLYSVDSNSNSSQSNDRTPISKSITTSKNNNKSSTFRSISKSIATTMGTATTTSATRNDTKKSDFSIAPKIFDRSKFLSCDIPKVIESQASCTEPAQSAAKVKSSSKLINNKLSKASTSANKLKYPISQPINKVTKIKSASISENNLKLKFKSLKIKSEDATQRNGSGDLHKAS